MLRSPASVLPPLALLALLAACAPTARPAATPAPAAPAPAAELVSASAFRVVDVGQGRDVGLDALVDAARAADVAFLGELHDDAVGHGVQLRVLEGLQQRGASAVLALEMFERDVQPLLDAYLAGSVPESELLANGRPWPNYAADYRPLVELARTAGWPVIAANVPRPLASAVATGGLAALDTLPPARRAHAAADIQCPDDAYRRKFVGLMGGGAGHGANTDAAVAAARLERYYQSQCVKDETMAEAVAAALAATPGRPVVHVNGSFHSDEGFGVPARLRRRLPTARIVVVSLVRVPDPATANLAAYAKLGDFVVLTRAVE